MLLLLLQLAEHGDQGSTSHDAGRVGVGAMVGSAIELPSLLTSPLLHRIQKPPSCSRPKTQRA